MESLEENMPKVKKLLIHRLGCCAAFQEDETVEQLYDAIYEYCRVAKIYPNEAAFSSAQKEEFLLEFPVAFEYAVSRTSHNCEERSIVNDIKKWLSKITFLKEDMINLYKEFLPPNEVISTDMEEYLPELERIKYNLKENLHLSMQIVFKDELKKYLPNLNGVPEDHDWWDQESREFWKDKEIFDIDVTKYVLCIQNDDP